MDVKVYLAGKITDSVWREEILGEKAHLLVVDTAQIFGGYDGFPVFQNVIEAAGETFAYCGPYFIDSTGGHGASLAPETHGLTAAPELSMEAFGDFKKDVLDNHAPEESLKPFVYRWCHNAILHSDVVFAWIDRKDIYGTLVEIGIAQAYRKQVWIGAPPGFEHSDLWFPMWGSDVVITTSESPLESFTLAAKSRLPDLLRDIPYDAYLTTNHWQCLRQSSLEYAEGRCQLCNDDENLHVHHRTYERRGNERPADLTVLCAECHAHFHQVVNGRPTKMPVRAA